jgi:glucokinase
VDYAIGIDLGATGTKALAVTADGRVVGERAVATDDGTHRRWAGNVRDLIAAIEAAHGSAAWVGVCGPGLVRTDHRAVAWMIDRMEATVGFEWTAFLGRTSFVPVVNDGQAALVGEAWLGAARGVRHAAMITLGTGVGGAIIADGRLLTGAIGRAGHIGHATADAFGAPDVCFMPGGIDDLIGNATVARRSDGRFADTRALVAAYRAGDADAAAVWLRSIRALGCVVASVVNIVDPEVVVIGGGIAEAGDALFGPLSTVMDEVEWRPNGHRADIRPARLGGHAGALGAARFAMTWSERP